MKLTGLRARPPRTVVALLAAVFLDPLMPLAAELDDAPLGPRRVSVRDHGATGNGQTLDTAALNAAIVACAQGGGGQVHFPPGRYLSGTLHLRGGVTLHLDAGARLIGTTNLAQYQQPTPPNYLPEAKWGSWHRALILGENVEDAAISGQGVIDGNRVFDPKGEERMRGPHTIVLVNCRRFTLRDIQVLDSANYAFFAQVSDDVDIRTDVPPF